MFHLTSSIPFLQTGLLPAFVHDYTAGKGQLSFLTKYPFSIDAFKQVIADKAKDNTDRRLLTEALSSQYSNIPTSQAVTANIQSLLDDNTFTIVAAHQPCLFMGPLYNIYKISCAINVSQLLKKQFPAYHFVPVFWLGSEDHDVEELNNTFINNKHIVWQDSGKGAAGRWKTASMKTAIEQLKSVTANTELVSLLEEGLSKYETFGRFTQYFVNAIFKGQGLVVLDQDDAHLKRKFIEVIKDEVFNSRAVQVLKENIEFLEINYKAQAKPRDINFFYLGDNYRERIVLNSTSGRFEVNNTSLSFSKNEMVDEIENHPERFSPNVIYRPLYQEMVLPNLAFVGGAGELSYWLELKPLFDYYKVNYPVQLLRNSAVITNASIQKKLEKLNLKVEDFLDNVELLINRYVQQNMSADSNLSNEKKRIEEVFESVLVKAEAADVTLKNNAIAEKQKAIAALENLESKILKAEKRKQETAVNQIRSIHAALFPEGILQERRENFIPYYTPEFIAQIVSHLDVFSKSFKVFTEG